MLKVRVLTACILAAALGLGLFVLPVAWTLLAFGVVFALAAWEWTRFGALRGLAARLAYTAAMAALLAVTGYWSRDPAHLLIVLELACAWWLVALVWIVVAPARQRAELTLLCAIPVLVPAFLALDRVLTASRGFARGPQMVLWMLLLVFSADIGAFFAGRKFGRHKLAPRVSPGKTWEGAIGGLAAVVMVALAWSLHYGVPVVAGVALGCTVGVFSVIGDLTESMFKRAAGLKDSGSLLPGHGGVLDRIDSVTAAAPLYALGLIGFGVLE